MQAGIGGAERPSAHGQRVERRPGLGAHPQPFLDQPGAHGRRQRSARADARSDLAGQPAHHEAPLEVLPELHHQGANPRVPRPTTRGRRDRCGSSTATIGAKYRGDSDARQPGRWTSRATTSMTCFTAPSAPASAPRLNGRYRIEDRIGSGGMSTVYRAFDETLEREVAIKIMHSDISSDDAALERFRREARTVAQLSHPHVVMVIDAGEDEGHPYIVFEHVQGRDAEGPHPPRGAAARRGGGRVRDRDRPRAAGCARARPRPPRREAAERADRRGGPREGDRLRHRARARVQAGEPAHRPPGR